MISGTNSPTWESDCGTIKLWLGDCLEVMQAWPDGAVDAVVTDPPYGIGVAYGVYDDTKDNWLDLMRCAVPECRRVGKFVVMPAGDRMALRQTYIDHDPDWLIAWVKGSPGTRSPIGFNSWEPHLCWGRPWKAMHDVFETRCGFEHDDHPCPKPTAWANWLVLRSAGPRQTIADPFMGSGTTGVAAVRLGRQFWGVELDPEYFEIAKRRIQDELRKVDFLEPQRVKERQAKLFSPQPPPA